MYEESRIRYHQSYFPATLSYPLLKILTPQRRPALHLIEHLLRRMPAAVPPCSRTDKQASRTVTFHIIIHPVFRRNGEELHTRIFPDRPVVPARYGTYAEGAIDALATNPADSSRALVIDYKTGGTPDETPEQLQEKHALQARVYADVLHKAGFEAVTVKFVRVEQSDPTIFVEPAEPQVVTYNL